MYSAAAEFICETALMADLKAAVEKLVGSVVGVVKVGMPPPAEPPIDGTPGALVLVLVLV